MELSVPIFLATLARPLHLVTFFFVLVTSVGCFTVALVLFFAAGLPSFQHFPTLLLCGICHLPRGKEPAALLYEFWRCWPTAIVQYITKGLDAIIWLDLNPQPVEAHRFARRGQVEYASKLAVLAVRFRSSTKSSVLSFKKGPSHGLNSPPSLLATFELHVLHSSFLNVKLNDLNKLERFANLCEHGYARSAASEVLETFFLVVAICLSPHGNFLVFIIRAALPGFLYAHANISGSHFNPAVMFVMFINGALELIEVYSHRLAQTMGFALHSWR